MIELIPAIDIMRCCTTFSGRLWPKKVYNENPVEVAKIFEAHGIHVLHVVDLDGAASKHVVNYKVLEALATDFTVVTSAEHAKAMKLCTLPSKASADGNAGRRRRKGAGYVQPMDGGIWQ